MIETLSKVSVMTHVTDIFVNFDPQVDFNINGEGAMTILITILSNAAPGKRILFQRVYKADDAEGVVIHIYSLCKVHL